MFMIILHLAHNNPACDSLNVHAVGHDAMVDTLQTNNVKHYSLIIIVLE